MHPNPAEASTKSRTILADIRMPIMDGKELGRELKSHRDSQNIPVVAITGYDTPEMQASAFKAGYRDSITKPINPGEFRAQIAKLLRQHPLKRVVRTTLKP